MVSPDAVQNLSRWCQERKGGRKMAADTADPVLTITWLKSSEELRTKHTHSSKVWRRSEEGSLRSSDVPSLRPAWDLTDSSVSSAVVHAYSCHGVIASFIYVWMFQKTWKEQRNYWIQTSRISDLLTITIDTLCLWDLCSWATFFVIIGKTVIQFHHQPLKAAGFFTWYGLHQMGAVPSTTSWFIDDFPLPQFEACHGTRGVEKRCNYRALI